MKVQLLNTKIHDRSRFNCEELVLTKYLKHQANQDMKKSLAACFVVVNKEGAITGYYTLSNASIDRANLPKKHQSKVPINYNVPVTLLGRLARDITQKGTGIGEFLLLDALQRSYIIFQKGIGSMAVVVDPISNGAVSFYEQYGFTKLPDGTKMFLPMKAIEKLYI